MTAKKIVKKKKPESVLSIRVEGQVFIVESLAGVETSRTEIEPETVGIVIRDYVESAILAFCDPDDAKAKAKARTKVAMKKSRVKS